MYRIIQILLLPFSLIYGSVMVVRNAFYTLGVFKTKQFDVPTICVGNLSTGGTGKTPHVKFLANYFNSQGLRVAVLSRGYGRKSKGFILLNQDVPVNQSGDEPKEILRSLPDIIVAVCESRVKGMNELLMLDNPPQIIILDDAYQHRALKAHYNILLTTWQRPFFRDLVLPAGRLREFPSGKNRADTIVVTKCPDISLQEKRRYSELIRPRENQDLKFSKFTYEVPYSLQDSRQKLSIAEKEFNCILFTAIAYHDSLELELRDRFKSLIGLHFPDHHTFSVADLRSLNNTFEKTGKNNTVIIVTEKDATKLEHQQFIEKLPVYVIGTSVVMENSDQWLLKIKKRLVLE